MKDPIAEIIASPVGARIGAFFDLDGTMLDGFTPAAHARHRIRRRQAGIGELLGTAEAALRYRFGRMEFERLVTRAAGYLRGTPLSELDDLGEELFRSSIRPRLHTDMTRTVRAHQDQGHTVVLSSSALTIHVAPVGRALGIGHVICNHFELDGSGRLTGGIVEPIIWGPRKAAAAVQFCAVNGVDLERSYFYADGDEDLRADAHRGQPATGESPARPGRRGGRTRVADPAGGRRASAWRGHPVEYPPWVTSSRCATRCRAGVAAPG